MLISLGTVAGCLATGTMAASAMFSLPSVHAFAPLQQTTATTMRRRTIERCRPLQITAKEAIDILDTSQKASVEQIASAISDLAPKPDFSWPHERGVLIANCPATLDAWDAPGPANVAWLSSLCVSSKLSALTIFNGPLTNAPHLLSRCAIVDDTNLSFALDFRPRAYGAYEMKQPDGTYPGPEVLGRQAFEYSGARRDFETKFAVEHVVAFMESTAASFEGASFSSTTASTATQVEQLVRGPLALFLTMPLTDTNVAAVVKAREQASLYWLGWATDKSHAHRPGAPVNTQYVYDSKYKQNAYLALLPFYSDIFGPQDGPVLAAADSGPLDEGYVGGGS